VTVTAIAARTDSPDATRALAAAVAGLSEPGDIVLLAGDLGTGKTAWVQGFASGLGVTDQVTSPTFTLVRPHLGSRLQLLHVDLYRLDHLSEVLDLGLLEQLDERPRGPGMVGTVACIEWGDLAEPAFPADFLEVRLELGEDEDERLIRLRAVGRRWGARMEGLRTALSPWTGGR
jgi:tRNA threonylcarbamoyladenosine biosynthesis protein TsaE